MDTSKGLQSRLSLAAFKKIIFLFSFFLLVSNSTLVHSKLIKFEFVGKGELYDQYLNPIDNGRAVSMSVDFVLDTHKLVSTFHGNSGGQLTNFSYLALANQFVLSVGGSYRQGDQLQSGFSGVAVSSLLDFWENSLSVDLGGTVFSVSQWARFGTVSSEGFLDGESKLEEYYSEMMGTVNGEWLFEKSKDEIYHGVLTGFSIYTIPEPSALMLLLIGLMFGGALFRR